MKQVLDGNAIKDALHAKGLSFGIIADAKEVSTSFVSRVAHRKTTSRNIAEAICKALDKNLKEVFSDVDSYSQAPSRRSSDRQAKVAELQQRLAS